MSAVLPPLPDYPVEVDRSARAIAAELRILADLIEASPDFPVRSHGLSVGQALNSEAEVRRVGEILGLHVSEDSRPDGSRAWRVDRPGALYMAWSYLEDAPETSPGQTAADSAAGQEAGDGVIDPSSPAAPVRPAIVLVASPISGQPPARAELHDDTGRGTTVKVIYSDSRTGARVARRRILGPAPAVEQSFRVSGDAEGEG